MTQACQRRTQIGTLIEHIESGVSVRSLDRPADEGEHGVLKVSAVSAGYFKPSENKRILDEDLERASVHPVAGCTLVSRANTLQRVGDCAYVEESRSDVYLPDKLWQLHPNRALVDPYWFSLMLASQQVRLAAGVAATGTSGSMKNISQARYLRIEVLCPPVDSQHRVGAVIRSVDALLRRIRALHSSMRARKRGLLHELLSGKRRFPEFGRARFATVRLGDHADHLDKRNGSQMGKASVMGVLKSIGLVTMRDHVRAKNLSRYLVVPPDAFAYNPMRLNIGSIARNLRGAPCLVSPDYVVFATNPATLLPAYLDQVRHSRIWSEFVRPAGAGSVRVRIYFRDVAELRIPLPALDEQRKIVAVLEALDREIVLLERLRDAYQTQKRALMSRLLSGDVVIAESSAAERVPANA